MSRWMFLLLLLPLEVGADSVYKCKVNGKTIYSDKECSSNAKTSTILIPKKITFKYGGSGCPSSKIWTNVLHVQEASARLRKLDADCSWLKKGTTVYGPLDKVKEGKHEFIKVELPSGELTWIELAQHI